MNRLMFIGPAGAAVITGLSLFVTRSVLDQTLGEEGPFRFALIPPWWHVLIDIVLGAVLVFALERAARRSSLPLIALAVLVIPFLPYFPDRWPVLQVLSGPLTPIVWLVAASLVAWRIWISTGPAWGPAWALVHRSLGEGGLPRMAIGIGLATAVIAGAAAWRLTGTNIFPGGDEPHYLVMAQSLWRDGDLKIENNHARGDYKEYYEADLKPHYHARGVDGEIYSIHPIGMPVLMAPVYAAGGYHAVVLMLILMASVAAALAWLWTAHALASPAAATFAWIAIACSAPFLFNTFTVYPEIAAALAVMIAITLTPDSTARAIGIGLACAALPWLSTKYAPMSAALLLVAAARLGSDPNESAALKFRAAVGIPYVLSLLGWFTFFYWYWGSPLPSAPYGADSQTTLINVFTGVPGLLFDQEYGLLAYAPVFVFAAFGLITMWRAEGELRRRAIEIAFVFAALIATVGAFDLWWGGSAAPARPIASGLLLLSLPIATAFKSAPAPSVHRAAQLALLSLSIGIATTLAVADGGYLIDNGRDGSSALLEYWSPRFPIWTFAPSFVRATPPPLDLRARSRRESLDTFDASVRPALVIYDSTTVPQVFRAVDFLHLLSLHVSPGQRTDPQPVRVIHNGRFSLPAGNYDISIGFGGQVPPQPTPLSLQVGRMGPPLQTTMVQATADGSWSTTLELPADAAFVGLRGAVELERAISVITIAPTSIVNASERPSIPEVLSSAQYGAARVMFHNVELVPEPGGFWTIGKRDGRITIAVARGNAMPHLRVHSGSAPNHATFSSGSWSQRLEMVPGQAYDVALPADEDGISTVDISTESGFTPSQADPASKDNRYLGIWVEVVANN